MKKRINRIILMTILIIIVLIFLSPIIWSFMTSLKSNVSAWSMPPKFIFKPSLTNYISAFKDRGFTKVIINSIVIAISATLISLVLGAPLAYMFARSNFKINNILFIFVFIAYILPPIVLSIPLYVIGAKLGLLDQYIIIILTHVTFCLAFTVWMLRGFFEEIPKEIEESARVDGCSYFSTLIRIVFPIARSGIIATIIFCIILSWNDFMYALVLTGVRTRTLPVHIAQYLTPHGMFWGQMSAAGMLAILPVLVFSLFLQKYLVRGMTAGAIK